MGLHLAKLFKEMDKNGDGRISEDEFQNQISVSHEEVLDRFWDEFGNADRQTSTVFIVFYAHHASKILIQDPFSADG